MLGRMEYRALRYFTCFRDIKKRPALGRSPVLVDIHRRSKRRYERRLIEYRVVVGARADNKKEAEETVTSAADVSPEIEAEIDDSLSTTEQRTTSVVDSSSPSSQFLPSTRVMTIARNGVLSFLGITFVFYLVTSLMRFLSPRAKRKRTVSKNRELIENLIKYLPDKREELTPRTAWLIRSKAGFTPTEVFRKYLWFVLRERNFDQSAVDDLICLKAALQLSEEDVATALTERAQRIYEKYGTLMLNTEGMTAAGVERKATCRALFSKILYLSETEQLISPESDAVKNLSLKEIFGATEEDENRLRIISLAEVDIDKLDQMVEEEDTDREVETSD